MAVVKVAFASCLNAADSGAFDRIRLLAPDYFFGLGDLWYDDGSTDHVAHWNTVFAAPKFAAMVAALPNPPIIGWSDHDFGFASNSVAGPMTATANSAYRSKFGSTGLPTQGIYRTWTVGRVRFVLCDERSFKSANAATDNASKTVLGATQKAWLKDLLASNTYPLIVVAGDTPWVGAATAGDDGWKGYSTEREELRQAYAASPAQVIRLNGDMHCLGVGTNQFGIDRVWQAAPLRNATKVKDGGAGYTGTYPTNSNEGSVEELFGLVTLDDNGSQIVCTYRGYSSDGTQRLTDTLTVAAPSSAPTGGSSLYPSTFPDGVAYPTIPLGSTTVNVSTSAQLTTALANASAGQRIVLANGTYSGAFAVTGKAGTGSAGISVEAASTGGAVFASGSTWTIKDSAYVTLKGLTFPYELDSGNLVQFRGSSKYCRVTRCLFGPTSVGTSGANKAPFVYGGDTVEFIRVDHNEFRNKANPGNTILFDGNFSTPQVVKHIRIDHNWLHSIKPEVTNEKEPIRFGVSTMSKTSSFSVIERNRLEDCICEPENISVKCCDVRVTGNTVFRCIGGVVYRHGLRGVLSDNYIVDRASTFGTTISSGGFRFYDADHLISYNYIDGIHPSAGNFQKPLLLDTGDAEGSSTNLSGHWRLVNAKVLNNAIVGCPEGIGIGKNYSSAPTGCTIDQNLVVQAASGTSVTQRIAPVSTTIGTNPYFSTPAAAGMSQGSDTIWRKAGYGPRLSFLQAGDVGVSGDVNDSDGTGVLVGVSAGTTASGQTLGVGGVATPPGAILATSDQPGVTLNITTSGTASNPRVYDGQGHEIGLVKIRASYIVVQNYKIRPQSQYGVDAKLGGGTGFHDVTIQNCDFKDLRPSGDGDLNCITLNGNNITIAFNTATNFVGQASAGSHTDFIQTWNDGPGDESTSNLLVIGNHAEGPPAETDSPTEQHIHQAVIGEGKDSTDGGGGGTGVSQNWFIADNWWTADCKFDDIDNVTFTRNTFAGVDKRAVVVTSLSSGFRYYSDNKVTGQTTVELGATVISGAGPANPTWLGAGTGGAQTVTAVGIASVEAFGSPTVQVAGAPAPAPPGARPTLLGSAVLGSAGLGYSTGGPVQTSQTVRASGIPSGQAFGSPVVSVADGPQTVVAIGVDSGEAFGRPSVSAGAAPAPAPGGVLVPSLWAVGWDGVTLTPLPAWTKISLSPQRNSQGSLSVDYPAGARGFSQIHDGVSAYPLKALEVRIWLGGSAEGALGGWLVQKSGDDLTPGSNWTFSGHFHEWILSKALVAPQPGLMSQALEFVGATAGLIFRTVLEQAQKRGALPLVTRDFTDTLDSNGQPWAKQVSSLAFPPKTTVAQVADKCVELDLCEFEVTAARVWRAYNPGTRGTDRTTGASPLMFRHTVDLREHSRRESAKDAGTAVLAAGGEGFYEWAQSATAQSELGWRAEVAVDAGQIKSQAGVQASAATQLEILRNGVAEYTSGIEFGPGSPLPILDYGVGDWALVWVGAKRRKLRIAQLSLDFAVGQSPKGTVSQNDLIADRVAALYRRLNAISSGDAVVGESIPTAGGAGEDTNPPAAPTGVTVSSTLAYQTPGESLTLAIIDVGWSPVTTNAYPDNETSGAGTAATQIALRMSSGQPITPAWTWPGAPAVVTQYAPQLLAEWQASSLNTSGSASAQTWLTSYAALHATGGAITNDVAHYRVQYRFLGATQVTRPGPRGEESPNQLEVDGNWQEPVESPTSSTSLSFGNVEGGRSVGVRVSAVDTSGNQGPWSVTVAVDTAADDQPPPAPSKPVVATWFRTIDITWDGKGSAGEDMLAAAPDFASGGGIEIHLSEAIDFTPDRPIGADGRTVDLSLSSTYKATLYAAGTWNVVDLVIGTTYYARLVAVDRNGNASEPSETSDGVLPKQLVTIDYGPDTIDRQTVRAAAIGSAEIDQLAVNDAHIDNVNVGKLRAGTMTANVVIGGRFSTPVATNGNQIQIDAAGIRLYQGNTVVGRWQVSDASMLVTGTYLSALSGKRINIAQSGTMFFYPPSGTNFGFLENLDGDIRMSGQVNQDQRAGYLLIDESRAALTYSQIATYNQPRTRFQVDPVAAASWAPIISNRIDRRIDVGALGPRWLYTNFDSSGDIGPSIVHLQQIAAAGSHAVMYGANANSGIVFDSNTIVAVHNDISPAPINAAAFNVTSASVAKRDIAPVAFRGMPAKDVVRAAPARTFFYRSEFVERPEKPGTWLRRFADDGSELPEVEGEWTAPQSAPVMRVGPMADDLLKVAPEIVTPGLARDGGMVLNVATIAGMGWAASAENADDIDALAEQVKRLSARLDALDPAVVDGEVVP